MLTSVMLAGPVGAATPLFHSPATPLRDTAVTPLSAVSAAETDLSGLTLIAAERPPVNLRIGAGPVAAMSSPGVLGIPEIALSAYHNAEQQMAVSAPHCGISWNLLAGIGRIESMHANHGSTDARGTAVQPIYGPALDGSLPGNEVIVQSSSAGQVTYVRAVGPMQFLPGTWARYAADGDGDGRADPQNLFDATLTAARYLCSDGLDLREKSQMLAAILRYNNSMAYARSVLGWAAAYATGVVPINLPPITGPPSPIGDTHLENPEGLGPALPLDFNGLPSTDPLARVPLIDLGRSEDADEPVEVPAPEDPASEDLAPEDPGCAENCVDRQDRAESATAVR